jgi:hypothetical protein
MSQQDPQQNPLATEEFIDQLLQSDVKHEGMKDSIDDLLAGDYALANMTSADREYFRLLAENISIYARERMPQEESWVQGSLGAALLDDPDFKKTAVDESERIRFETALMDHFARSSRGVSGWQQDKLTETIQTNRVEDNRNGEDDTGGLFG